MAYRIWLVMALLAAAPAAAEVVSFQAHSIDVDAATAVPTVQAVRGAAYSIPGSTLQTIGKVQACLGRAESGVGIVAVDAVAGQLRAVSRTSYRHDGQARLLKTRWAIQATDGNFRITFTDLAEVRAGAEDETYVPLQLDVRSGWENAVRSVIDMETALLDCMYR